VKWNEQDISYITSEVLFDIVRKRMIKISISFFFVIFSQIGFLEFLCEETLKTHSHTHTSLSLSLSPKIKIIFEQQFRMYFSFAIIFVKVLKNFCKYKIPVLYCVTFKFWKSDWHETRETETTGNATLTHYLSFE